MSSTSAPQTGPNPENHEDEDGLVKLIAGYNLVLSDADQLKSMGDDVARAVREARDNAQERLDAIRKQRLLAEIRQGNIGETIPSWAIEMIQEGRRDLNAALVKSQDLNARFLSLLEQREQRTPLVSEAAQPAASSPRQTLPGSQRRPEDLYQVPLEPIKLPEGLTVDSVSTANILALCSDIVQKPHFRGFAEQAGSDVYTELLLDQVVELSGIELDRSCFADQALSNLSDGIPAEQLMLLAEALLWIDRHCVMVRFDFRELSSKKAQYYRNPEEFKLMTKAELKRQIKRHIIKIKAHRGVYQFYDDIQIIVAGRSYGIYGAVQDRSEPFFSGGLPEDQLDLALANMIQLYLAYRDDIVKRWNPESAYYAEFSKNDWVLFYDQDAAGKLLIKKDDGKEVSDFEG